MVFRWERQSPAPDTVVRPGIGNGACGYALISHYAAKGGLPGASNRFVSYIERAASLFNEGTSTAELYRGITGLGWLLAHFGEEYDIAWAKSAMDQIDELISEEVSGIATPEMDLIGGLTGIMVYGLARQARDGSSDLATLVGNRMQRGVSEWLASTSATYERGFWLNAGVAHGVPGAILALLQAHRQGVHLDCGLADVLTEALNRIWTFAVFESDGGANFPYQFGSHERARLAWCYGALGVVQLYSSSTDVHPGSAARYERIVHSILQQATASDTGITDASLCHGKAGLAFVLNRISRDRRISERQRQSAGALAENYLTSIISEELMTPYGSTFIYSSEAGKVPSSTFLTGGIGIALTVQAWNRPLPAWAELLTIY
jgi:hypothetical protein